MNEADSEWRRFPVFREFFLQWRIARGGAEPGAHKKVFSRDWEELLRDAGLLSALDRREAVADVRILESAGMLKLKTPSQRPEEILRVSLPLEAEPRLRTLFADELPVKVPAFDFESVDWAPELNFLKNGGVNIAPDDLIKLNDFFRASHRRVQINIKERSLQIFGDEKRLDALRTTTLFREDRLTLEALRCFTVAEPLGWQRGSNRQGPILVIENACTWDTYGRWNQNAELFSAIVYGGGNRFMDSASRLGDVFAEIGGIRQVLYFGDLDPQGLRIPCAASKITARIRLPLVEPDLWSYQQLLAIGKPTAFTESSDATEADFSWIGSLALEVKMLFDRGQRLAQESVSWDWLNMRIRPPLSAG